ncbi:MAG: acyl carrier protein phosphodiesterase [Ignavibacteria bacterium]|nr:acyl carrier protein phosphodiesterase [Ignavibacteria bacterium]
MNYLAHAYLSGDDPEILFGNFVADSIKGKKLNDYPLRIQEGVQLHRAIDNFTDQHEIVRQCNELLQPIFRKYAGVITDIYFDHFLALHWHRYSEKDLVEFSMHVYQTLLKRYTILPPRSRRILPWMMAQNWLVGYANLRDLQRVFNGMSRRTKFDSGMENAVVFLVDNYLFFERNFNAFFPELMQFSTEFMSQIPNKSAD